MRRSVTSIGTIDDLSTCVDIYPQGKTALQRLRHVINLIIYVFLIIIITTMQLIQQHKIDISPDYLLQLSKQVDVLSKLALLDRQGSLTQEFSRVLQAQFTQLSQYLALYHEDNVMKDCALLKCKFALEFYVWERANKLIPSMAGELTIIMKYLLEQFKEQITGLQTLIHRERMSKAEVLDAQKDKIITNLRKDLGVKREYMIDLEQRVRQVEDQNSKLYSKMITHAKQKVDYYSRSPNKTQQFRSTSSDKNASPRKKILTRSYQDEINQILQSKWKIEGLNQKRSSLSDYLKTYFTMKYGKPLAEQNQAGFREAVAYLAHNQQKHIFVLFQTVLDEQCDEAFFQEERVFLERVIRCLKRYLNQKYGRPLHELDRIFQSRSLEDKNDFFLSESDVQTLLSNIYKSGQVRTLQMIISELAFSRSSQVSNKLSCKKLINEILDYEMKKHFMRVEDIVREINRLPDRVDKCITLEQLQKVALRVIRDKQRCEMLLREEQQEKKWTASEVIELIERIRHMRLRKQ